MVKLLQKSLTIKALLEARRDTPVKHFHWFVPSFSLWSRRPVDQPGDKIVQRRSRQLFGFESLWIVRQEESSFLEQNSRQMIETWFGLNHSFTVERVSAVVIAQTLKSIQLDFDNLYF